MLLLGARRASSQRLVGRATRRKTRATLGLLLASFLLSTALVLGYKSTHKLKYPGGTLSRSKDPLAQTPLSRTRTVNERIRRHKVSANAVEEASIVDRVRNSGIAATATAAAQAVSTAVAMRKLEAPDLKKSYIVVDKDDERMGKIDEAGLPLIYDKELIEKYWNKQSDALNKRWTEFLGYSVPFLTKVAGYLIQGGTDELAKHDAQLARDARVIMEKLGPTYIKLGQTLSVRPDVLPQAALDELAILQDGVKPFPTEVAFEQIERELGQPLGAVFSEISEDPVAAASLAQVYRAKLASTGESVAVKVQRPGIQETVSKDLYVLRRAAEVYQGLVERFAPQQKTDYVALLNEWAVGFYTELDFTNEGKNQMRLKKLLEEEGVEDVYVPHVFQEHCTRRLLVSEWIDGVKLSQCEPDDVRELIEIGQECFLVQLLQVGFFHADPHPGNLLKMTDTSKGKVALLDFGLMASVKQDDIDVMVNALVHLANKDYPSLVDDFIGLRILPPDCDRSKVIPLMDKALSPYVKGGGAKKYEEEIRKMYGMDGTGQNQIGGFQAMTQDALTVLNDIPFSIPPYFALLGRAIVTLEGIALSGNPDYGIITEAYPFVARKLLREDRPEIQRALQQILYGTNAKGLGTERLAVLLNSALGVVAKSSAFIDFETLPDDAVSLEVALKFILSQRSASLRGLLETEIVNAADVLLRLSLRKAARRLEASIPTLPGPFSQFLPKPADVPIPILLPTLSGTPRSLDESKASDYDQTTTPAITMNAENFGVTPVLVTPEALIKAAAPKLSREEELYALSLKDITSSTFGPDAAAVIIGDGVTDPQSTLRFLIALAASGGQLSTELQQAIKAVAPQLMAGVEIAEGKGSNASGLNDFADAVNSLDKAEREALSASFQRIIEEVWSKFAKRLTPLASTPIS